MPNISNVKNQYPLLLMMMITMMMMMMMMITIIWWLRQARWSANLYFMAHNLVNRRMYSDHKEFQFYKEMIKKAKNYVTGWEKTTPSPRFCSWAYLSPLECSDAQQSVCHDLIFLRHRYYNYRHYWKSHLSFQMRWKDTVQHLAYLQVD